MHLPLNALRAFEASARHLSFTKAGLELRVSQTAISLQVKQLEETLAADLFRRLPRGLALTDEGFALLPVLTDAFDRVSTAIDRVQARSTREVVTIGCVATFATGWLLHRIEHFRTMYPLVDLRLLTNNNRVDIAGDGLDFALRFGDGAWHATEAIHLLSAPLSPLCHPDIARRLQKPSDHSSIAMVEAASQGAGVALVPAAMFHRELKSGRLTRPFTAEVAAGAYWLTWLKSKKLTFGMLVFRDWLLATLRDGQDS